MDTSLRICVIGAGPSGLTAAKNLLDAGFHELTVFDRGDRVGGNWVFDADSGHSSVFETTHIISSRRYSQYDDFPMPASYADYPGHRELAEYFQGYADHFGLLDCIRFQTLVESCERLADGRWSVTSRHVDSERTRTETFDQLVVCNGHHWQPRWPDYPGEFTGEYLHSHDFKKAEPFRDRRVLVIGGGNSACDVAVETSRVAQRTDISWRRGYWISPKFIFGLPSDYLHNFVSNKLPWLPRKLRLRGFELLLALLQGRNARYGLPDPDHHLTESHPTINSELLYFIRHGEIHPRPDIARFAGKQVHFTDGQVHEYDAIVACTGFVISHPFFNRDFIDYSEGPVPLYLKMIHPDYDNLHFVGLFQPLGCIWPLAELQAKILARRLTGRWQPPKDLHAAVADELANPDVEQVDSPRHTITVDYPSFRRRLLAELPADYVSRQPIPRERPTLEEVGT